MTFARSIHCIHFGFFTPTRCRRLSQFFFLFTLLWCIMMFTAACATSWVSEAVSIVQLLVPSISSILGILAAFGVGISPNVLTAIQSWGTAAQTDLQTVGDLINSYNSAEASAQPGILTSIETALTTVVNNLNTILPELHVTDASTQAKITAVINAFVSELQALINLVPAVKSAMAETDAHAQLLAITSSPAFAQLQSAKTYKKAFNALVAGFGKSYEIA